MANKIMTISPIHINTSYDRPQLDVGMAGVMLINPSDHEGLQTYHSTAGVINDYSANTSVYGQASLYFSNDNSPLFQVLSYKAGDGNSLTNTMTKYYDAGAQYFLVHMSVDDKNLSDISAISNFVEAQDHKELIVSLSYSDKTKLNDAVANLHIDKNMSTLVNATDNNSGYLGIGFLTEYANSPVGTDASLMHDLPSVTPQDKYEFSKSDLDQYFTPNHIATYAYREGIPMMTSGFTQSGDQFHKMVVRDAISRDVTASVLNIFMKNGRIPYDQTGIDMFDGAIGAVLKRYEDNRLIEPGWKVTDVKSDDVKETKKSTGKLTGMGWKYTPVSNIEDVTFNQTVVLPQE